MGVPASTETCAENKLALATKDVRIQGLQRAQWLRAALLGANDGLLSTTSLMIGIGAAKEDQRSMMISGLAGALAGACSMAVGEFVSVATQRDIEKMMMHTSSSKFQLQSGDLQLASSCTDPAAVRTKLAESQIVTPRGLTASPKGVIPCGDLTCDFESSQQSGLSSPATQTGKPSPYLPSPALTPITQVIHKDARSMPLQESTPDPFRQLEALPNPYKAAVASASSFLFGAMVPLATAYMVSGSNRIRVAILATATSVALVLFGGIGAHFGGSSIRVSAIRILLGGWISMAITYGLLKSFDQDDHRGS